MDYQQPPQSPAGPYQQQPPGGAYPSAPSAQPGAYPPPAPPASYPPQGYATPPAYTPQAVRRPLVKGPNAAAIVGMIFGLLAFLAALWHCYYNPIVQTITNPFGALQGFLAGESGGLNLAQWFGAVPFLVSIVGIACSSSGGRAAVAKGGKGMATAGLVFGILALVISIIQLLSCGVCVQVMGSEAGSMLESFL